jgi:hypothetical protein
MGLASRTLVILAALLSAAQAHEAARGDVDTEHIFGFTEGSDIGAKGEKELESTFTGRFGKPGHFAAIENDTAFRYGVSDAFRASFGITSTYHRIGGVPDLDDRNAFNFGGVSGEFRWRLLERGTSPIGLTLSFSPQWRRVDEISGAPVQSLTLPVALLADMALIPDKLFAAFNVIFSPSVTRADGAWEQENQLEISAALSLAIGPSVFIGAEVRHLTRNDEGFLSGHALFVGPSLFAKVSETFSLKAAWSAQIPDESTRALDLVRFERHQVRVLLVKNLPP